MTKLDMSTSIKVTFTIERTVITAARRKKNETGLSMSFAVNQFLKKWSEAKIVPIES